MPPDSYGVILSEAATADLIAIEDWLVGESDPATAASYIDRVLVQIGKLDHFPHRGTPRSKVVTGLRSITFERRIVIFYRVQGATVSIRRIVDAARDLTGFAL